MPQLPLRLPTRNEAALIALALLVLLFASWLRRGEKIAELETLLSAKPKIEIRTVTRTVTKREVGPIQVHEKIVFRADGSKESVDRVVDKAASSSETDKAADVQRKETPVGLPAPRRLTRWAYLDFDPIKSGAVPVGGRLGMDVFERFAVGAWYYHPATAFGATVGARF